MRRGMGYPCGLLVAGTLVLAPVGPAVAVDATAQRVQEVTAKAQAAVRYRAEFTLTVMEGDRPSRLTGTIWYQQPDKRRIEFAPSLEAEDVAQLVVSDGVAEWQHFPAKKLVYRTDWATMRAAGADPNTLQLRGLHQPFIDVKPETIRLVTTKTEGRQAIYVFEAEPAGTLVVDAPFTPGTIRLEVSAADGLTRRLAMTDAQGQEILIQQYTKVEVNPPIAPSQFQFTPPPGTQVTDVSADRARALSPTGAGQ